MDLLNLRMRDIGDQMVKTAINLQNRLSDLEICEVTRLPDSREPQGCSQTKQKLSAASQKVPRAENLNSTVSGCSTRASSAFEKVFFEPPIMPGNRLSPHLRWLSRLKPVEIVPEGRTYSRLSSGFGR